MKPADCPESAVKYLEGLSTDATEEGEFYFFLPYASGSDYSGSTVEKANQPGVSGILRGGGNLFGKRMAVSIPMPLYSG